MNEAQVNAVVGELKGIIDGLTQRVMDLAGNLAIVSQQNEALQAENKELQERSTKKIKNSTQPNEGDLP